MADYHDFANAQMETNAQIGELQSIAAGKSGGDEADQLCQVIGAGFELLALSVRELGTRVDYLLRDVNRRG